MEHNIKKMLKTVIKYDFVLMLIVLALCFIVKIQYILVVESGLLIAVINFTLNSVISNSVLLKENPNKALLFLPAFGRVILVCIIGFIFYKISQYYILAYILGFTLQYVALIAYGLKLKN